MAVAVATMTSSLFVPVYVQATSVANEEESADSDELIATLNGASFNKGDTIIIYGSVGERESGKRLYIRIFDPNRTELDVQDVALNSNGTFRHGFIAGADSLDDGTMHPMTEPGIYTIQLLYYPPGDPRGEGADLTFEYSARVGMIRIAPYPDESSLFPEHLIIPFIALTTLLVILYVIARIKRRSLEGAQKRKTTKDLGEQKKITEDYPRPGKEQGAVIEPPSTEPPSTEPPSTEPPSTEPPSTTEKSVGTPSKHKKLTERITPDFTDTDKHKVRSDEFKIGDIISFLAVIVTIALAFIAPLSQLPTLDYTVVRTPATSTNDPNVFEIVIRHLYGSVPAKNVLISMIAENTNFRVLDSEPYLANDLEANIRNATSSDDQIGKALLRIKELPPGSHTIIRIAISKVPGDQSEANLVTHVRSDEGVAYPQTYDPFIFYVSLIISYAIVAYAVSLKADTWLLKKEEIIQEKEEIKINYDTFLAIAILISAGIIAANLLLYRFHLEPDSVLYQIFYYGGTILVPVTGTILWLVHEYYHLEDYHICLLIGGMIISGLLAVNLLLYLPQIEHNNIMYYYAGTLVVPLAVIIASTVYTLRGDDLRVLIACAGLIISALIAASLLFYFPPIDNGNTFYPLHYWVGILIIPVMIVIILAIYHEWKKLIVMSAVIGILAAIFSIPFIYH